jgi:hypothetical protein
MNPRIAVALPVLPALAHAATLRWAAADLVPDDTFGGWYEVIDGLRALSTYLIGFAVVLGLVALLKPGLARLVGTFLLYASLPVQVLWIGLQVLVLVEELGESDLPGVVAPTIKVLALAAALAFLAASIVAVVALRRSRLPTPEAVRPA